MDIKITGIHIQVGDALSLYVKEHLERNVHKYFDTAISADVHFSKQGNQFLVNIVINEGVKNGIVIKSNGSAVEAYDCFNDAMDKAITQLRKYKDKIKNYRRENGGIKNVEIS